MRQVPNQGCIATIFTLFGIRSRPSGNHSPDLAHCCVRVFNADSELDIKPEWAHDKGNDGRFPSAAVPCARRSGHRLLIMGGMVEVRAPRALGRKFLQALTPRA